MSAAHEQLDVALAAVYATGPVMHFAINTDAGVTGELVSDMARFAAYDDGRRVVWLSPASGPMEDYIERYDDDGMSAPLTGSTHGPDTTLRFHGRADVLRQRSVIDQAGAVLVGRSALTQVQFDGMLRPPLGSEVPEHVVCAAMVTRWQITDSRLMYPARTTTIPMMA